MTDWGTKDYSNKYYRGYWTVEEEEEIGGPEETGMKELGTRGERKREVWAKINGLI